MTQKQPLERIGHNHCPIRERTADGVSVGRCWHHAPDGLCPRHGDVSAELAHYRATGKLSEEHWYREATR